MAAQQLIYINNSSVSEASTAVLLVQGNTALYFYYFKTITIFDVTGPLTIYQTDSTAEQQTPT
ncbi:hypothetical protein XELAEV_18022429mg [Xenopus laevis]|uniref:Uncharacterized protein n=1 Tax=Xenopus laevis TaxID=8355 RepID=A0A974HNE1_XENLA|nr:hypothetical protein XELAEV_18022429mg [Xenopus laevis]